MEAMDPADLRPVEPPARPPPIELFRGGVRRDRSAQFARLRLSGAGRRPSRAWAGASAASRSAKRLPHIECSDTEGVEDEIARICEEASKAHASLVSKLAQHNGLRQFSVEFTHRVPPLELRTLLPELEVAIVGLLENLRILMGKLKVLKLPDSGNGASRRLRDALDQHYSEARQEAQAQFDNQRQHLRELAARSPLQSPLISPVIGKKIAEALNSPSMRQRLSTRSPSLASTASPVQSLPSGNFTPPSTDIDMTDRYRCAPVFAMELLDDSDGEDKDGQVPVTKKTRPFESLFASN